MPLTPNLELPFPVGLGDENNPPADIKALAQAMDAVITFGTYEPVITSVVSATATASYVLIRKLITVDFDVVLGGAITANPTVSLPPGMEFAIASARGIGTALLHDASPANSRLATVSVSNQFAVSMSYEQSNVRLGLAAAGPWTWAAGDSIRGSFTARIK